MHELTPPPDDDQDEIEKCPVCDDDLMRVKAEIIKALGLSVAFTPVLLILLSFTACMLGKTLVVDERIVLGCLAAWAAIIGYAFKQGVLKI